MPPQLARLLAGLSGANEQAAQAGTVRVVDVSAGIGDLLVAVLDALPEDATPSLWVAEANAFRARLLRRRLIVHGIAPQDTAPPISTSAPVLIEHPNVLLARMEYRAAEGRNTEEVLLTVGDLADDLAPGATAVILGPADALIDALPPHSHAAQLRTKLLASGAVSKPPWPWASASGTLMH